MSSVALVARLALAGVFALASCSKLVNLTASADAVIGFGVPRRFARAAGTALPLAELSVAAALLLDPSARWGAVGALVLLAIFSAGVGYALRQGRAPDCNCFGQVASAPVSSRTLVRNGVLAAVALFAAAESPGSALTSWTSNGSAANLVAALASVTAAVLATVVYARRGAASTTSPHVLAPPFGAGGLPEGTPAPDFDLPGLDGHRVSLRDLLARGRSVVLIFASPTCSPCVHLLPHLARWNAAISHDVTLVVVESGWHGDQLPDQQRAALEDMIAVTEPDRSLASAYRTPGTPCAVWLSADGLISSPPMPGASQVERLIRRVLETGAARPPGGQNSNVTVSA